MPRYEWQGSGRFRNGRDDEYVDPGEEVELPESVARNNSSLVEVVESDVADVDETPELGESDEDEDTYICGAETADGTPCEREVDSPDATCWNH